MKEAFSFHSRPKYASHVQRDDLPGESKMDLVGSQLQTGSMLSVSTTVISLLRPLFGWSATLGLRHGPDSHGGEREERTLPSKKDSSQMDLRQWGKPWFEKGKARVEEWDLFWDIQCITDVWSMKENEADNSSWITKSFFSLRIISLNHSRLGPNRRTGPLALFGNGLDIPSKIPGIAWGQTHGDYYQPALFLLMRVGGNPII